MESVCYQKCIRLKFNISKEQLAEHQTKEEKAQKDKEREEKELEKRKRKLDKSTITVNFWFNKKFKN